MKTGPAKILHPDLFRDGDMKKEMQAFYAEVYGKTIKDLDADRILRNFPPA
jgi:iron complex transport system substrate-binding protein